MNKQTKSTLFSLAFLIPFLRVQIAPLTLPCFCCLYMPFLSFSLISSSFPSYGGLLPSLCVFLYRGAERSCTRQVSLKSMQLCSTTFSLGTTSQDISSNNSLNNLKFTLLKFSILNPLFARLTFLKSMVTAIQAASNLHVFNDLFCIGKHQVQQCFPSGWFCSIPEPESYC